MGLTMDSAQYLIPSQQAGRSLEDRMLGMALDRMGREVYKVAPMYVSSIPQAYTATVSADTGKPTNNIYIPVNQRPMDKMLYPDPSRPGDHKYQMNSIYSSLNYPFGNNQTSGLQKPYI